MINEFCWGDYDDRDNSAIDPAILDEIAAETSSSSQSKSRSKSSSVSSLPHKQTTVSIANETSGISSASSSCVNFASSSNPPPSEDISLPLPTVSTAGVPLMSPEEDEEICAVGGILTSFSSVSSDTEQVSNNSSFYYRPNSELQGTRVQQNSNDYSQQCNNLITNANMPMSTPNAQTTYYFHNPMIVSPSPAAGTAQMDNSSRTLIAQQLSFHPTPISSLGYANRMMMTSSSSSTSPPPPLDYNPNNAANHNNFSRSLHLLSSVQQGNNSNNNMQLRQQPSRIVKSSRYNSPIYHQYTNTPLPPKKKTAWMKFAQSFERIILPENIVSSNNATTPSDTNTIQYLPGYAPTKSSQTQARHAVLPIIAEKNSTSRSTGDDDDEDNDDSSEDDDEDEHQEFALFNDFTDQDYNNAMPMNEQEAQDILDSYVNSLTDPVGKVSLLILSLPITALKCCSFG